ncbi:MAG: hypothetical protein ACOZF0_16350 [Thermodesulfobacteriota bacterium]
MNLKPVILLLILVCCACASPLARIAPMENSAAETALAAKCRNLFPTGKWQLLHAIEADAPDGRKAFLQGLMILEDEPPGIRCALMTLEGFVLFEAAVENGDLAVNRAVAPFDSPALAKGMMDDIRLIFFPPETTKREYGRLPDGEETCRHHLAAGGFLDLTMRENGDWVMKRYDDKGTILRSVTATDLTDSFQKSAPWPGTLKLKAHGLFGYELTMHLVEALPLE